MANINVGKVGIVYAGALSATAPTSATSSLVGFTSFGEITTDGVTETLSKTTKEIKGNNKPTALRIITTEGGYKVKVAFLETNKEVVELFYNTTVDSEGGVSVAPGADSAIQSFVIDFIDGEDAVRIYIPAGQVTALDDVKQSSGDATIYGVEITALADASGITFGRWVNSLASL